MRFPYRLPSVALVSTVLLLSVLLVTAQPAAAAQTTWADPAGLCAGNSPCFTTVAAAIANAGPAPAEVFLFPGTYPESVDLGTMGSALPGGLPGALSVVSVDALGQPAPGAVIDPGAPGGPGTGPALTATAFPGSLTLDGLVVTSPDDNGIFLLSGTQPVLLARLEASNCAAGNGAVIANDAGLVRLEDSLARLNFNAGFVLASDTGTVEVASSLSERNATGYSLFGVSVSVVDSQATANDQNGWLVTPTGSAGVLTLDNVDATSNGAGGVSAVSIVNPDTFAIVDITEGSWSGNGGQGGIVFGESLSVRQLTADDNGDSGFTGFGDTAQVSNVSGSRNGDTGVGVVGQTIVASFVTADDNTGPGTAFAPFDSPGSSLTLTRVDTSGNTEDGVSLVIQQSESFATALIFNVETHLNGANGLAGTADDLTVSLVNATGNGNIGIGLFGDRVEGEMLTATGNGGFGIGVFGENVTLRDSQSVANLTGFVGFGERMVYERLTATSNGPSTGNLGEGAGYTLFLAGDLEAFDTVADLNEVGWLFPPTPTPAPAVAPAIAALGPLGDLAPAAEATITRVLQSLGGGPLTQRVTILTSRIESNSAASMQLDLFEPSDFRVSCSDFVTNGPAGLELQSDSAVDARINWWGDPTGPTHPNNPGGTGDPVLDSANGAMGTVDWDGFLPQPASAEDCPVPAAVEIPALDGLGLGALALLLATAALAVLRRRRRA